MLRKLTVLLMAALFSVSVAGLSFAAEEEKQGATPATPATPAKKEGAVNPCAASEKEMEKKEKKREKAIRRLAKKKYSEWKKKGEVPGPVEK